MNAVLLSLDGQGSKLIWGGKSHETHRHCADGTWNDAERRNEETGRISPTNVLKVARAVRPQSTQGVVQVVYYHEGVGTDGGSREM